MHPLAEKLSKERAQQKEEEIKEDQSVQGLSHHGLPALWRTQPAYHSSRIKWKRM